jgi:hypothetical protein
VSARNEQEDPGIQEAGKQGADVRAGGPIEPTEVSALAVIGEFHRARDLTERLLREASPLGLYAEGPAPR